MGEGGDEGYGGRCGHSLGVRFFAVVMRVSMVEGGVWDAIDLGCFV